MAGQYAPYEQALAELQATVADRLTVVPLDVSDMESVRNAAEATLRRHPVLDLVVNNAGILGNEGLDHTVNDGLDYESISEVFDVNSLGPLRVIQALLPALLDSDLKRLCFVSSEAGAITRSYRTAWYGYCMSKAALNMGVSILFNDLRRHGFTFRLYHPGWMRTFMSGTENTEAELTPAEAARKALAYFLDAEIDEDRLVMSDEKGHEWPW